MQRRSLIAASMGALATAPLIAAPAMAATRAREIDLGRTYVTSLSPERMARYQGGALTLVRDTARGYDPNSVAVLSEQGTLLGYLPTALNRTLAPLLDAGLQARGDVVEIATHPRPAIKLTVLLST